MSEKIQLSICLSLPHSLRQLMLSNTKVTDEGLLQLSELVRLKILYLDRTTVSDAGIVVVKGRPCRGTPSSMVRWCCPPPPFYRSVCGNLGGNLWWCYPSPCHPFFSLSFLWIFVEIGGGATFWWYYSTPLFFFFFFFFFLCGSVWKLGWQPLFIAAGIGANSKLCTSNSYCVLLSNTVLHEGKQWGWDGEWLVSDGAYH